MKHYLASRFSVFEFDTHKEAEDFLELLNADDLDHCFAKSYQDLINIYPEYKESKFPIRVTYRLIGILPSSGCALDTLQINTEHFYKLAELHKNYGLEGIELDESAIKSMENLYPNWKANNNLAYYAHYDCTYQISIPAEDFEMLK
jgi:hypothetical protein